jgi:hypothetical protein
MEILGFGKPKGHKFQHNVGDTLIYTGKSKTYLKNYGSEGKTLTVRSRMYEKGQNVYCCSTGNSKKVVMCVVEDAVSKAPKSTAKNDGLGKLKPFKKIQDVDKRAKEIQRQSGVKETKTVKFYHISRAKAKKMAWKELKA